MNFWQKLKPPIMVSAPMEGISDAPFRFMLAKYGKADVMFTEFASVDGLCSEEGRERIRIDLSYGEAERPITVQLFGSDPEKFYRAAKIVADLGFDGVDINMGCPDKQVVKYNGGASLINDPSLAQEIVLATREGAGERPVSVKTRLGYSEPIIEKWVPVLTAVKPAAITLHGRTKKEMFRGQADWNLIGRAAEIIRESGIIAIGNGGIKSRIEAGERAKKFGLDGVMVGRALWGNPWFFNPDISKTNLPLGVILQALLEHAKIFESIFGGRKNFVQMRRRFAAYLRGIPEARNLKSELMKTQSAVDVAKVLARVL
ncbi:MAG: tRNA-dihydrouridine synthase [Patescibacteria group bacterium]